VVNGERSVENIRVGDFVRFSFNVLGSVQWVTQEITVALDGAVSQLGRTDEQSSLIINSREK
jgi:hypothetical protein